MKIKGYKAFNPGLVCNGKQYSENTTFEEPKAVLCECGMHFCQNPMDVLEYYPLINNNGEFAEFAEVVADGETKTNGNKSCTTKLHVGAKLSFGGFVKVCVDFLVEKTNPSKVASGNSAQIGSSVDYAKIGSSVDYAQIGSSGYSAKIGSSGDSAKIGSSGDYAKIGSSGKHSVVCCAGHGGKVKAKIGSWITLAEWDMQGEEYIPVCVKTVKVDGKIIKEDNWYTLKNGEFVEVE